MRVLTIMLAAIGGLGFAAPLAAAQPADFTVLGNQILAAKVVRLPSATLTVDDDRITAELSDMDRVLITAPGGLDAYGPDTVTMLRSWSANMNLRLTVIEGYWLRRFGDRRETVPMSASAWRPIIAFGDATDVVLGRTTPAPLVRATPAQFDQLSVNTDRPGVRIVTAPPDSGFIDFGSVLAKQFPGELIAVIQGRWIEFAGAGQRRAAILRDAIYDDAVRDRGAIISADIIDRILDRVVVPPRPALRPAAKPAEQAWHGEWLVVLAAACVGLIGWLLIRFRRPGVSETLRLTKAEAFTRINELGARLLDSEAPDPRASERYATARTLFEQARTPLAMAEVTKIAEEGLGLAEAAP